MEAMKHTVLAAGLIVLLGAGSLGCKTTNKLAWWKKDKAAEETALAHSPPPLPSDIAKQAEGSKSTSAQLAGGEAAPFSSNPTGKGTTAGSPSSTTYPSTSAPAFTPGSVGQLAASTGGTSPASSANLGSISLPYNPNAAPAVKPDSGAATPAMLDAGRYAMGGLPAYGDGNAAVKAGADALAAAPAYGSDVYNAASQQANGVAANSTAGALNSAVNSVASSISPYTPSAPARYGAPMTASTSPASTVQASPSSDLASSKPYRPAGTSSYPTGGVTSPGSYPEVATRPDSTGGTSSGAGATSQAPLITMPSSRY
jgi:hypothetical protein